MNYFFGKKNNNKNLPAPGAEVNISSRLDVGITSKATAPAVPINKIDLSITYYYIII